MVPAPKERRRPLRRGLYLVAVLVLLLGAFRWINSPGAKSIQRLEAAARAAGEPITPAELDAWYPAVLADQNAALLVVRALDGSPRVDPKSLPERNAPWTEALLLSANGERARLAGVRSNLAVALRLPAARYPLVLTQSYATLAIPHLAPVKSGSHILAFWARHSAVTGRPDEAVEALLDSIRLAHTLDHEPIVISELVRIAILTITARATEDCLATAPLPAARLAELQAAFSDAAEVDGMARALAGERVLASELLRLSPAEIGRMMTLTGGPGPAGSGWQEAAQTVGATAYRLSGAEQIDHQFYLETIAQLIRGASLRGAERLRVCRQIETDFVQASKRWNRSRSRMLLPALLNLVDKPTRCEATLRCTVTALAIERYRAEHQGALPQDLAALVPRFLPSVPLDPLDEKPLRYRPLEKGYRVHSVGLDQTDDGGKPFEPGKSNASYDDTFTVPR